MFERLAERLQGVFRELGRRGKLREQDVDQALREIRLALLEADVHFQVVRELLERVRARVLSEEVSRALNPAQQVARVVHEALVEVLGEPGRLELVGARPRAVMLLGLQGSGKTTTAAKLARWLRARGERVWLVAADLHRPAAVEQLQQLGALIDVPVYYAPGRVAPALAAEAMEAAGRAGASVVVLDTAGRSQLDGPMMGELQAVTEAVRPVEKLLVADAMTGQEAVDIARGFHEAIGLTGLILTKMDGDARGGAAVSMCSVTGVPIKFIGTGERLEELQPFEPERLASRILGMGDLLTLLEKAEAQLDKEKAEAQAERLLRGEFTLEDFAEQLAQVRQMGPLGKLLELMPGAGGLQVDPSLAERQLVRTQAIIQSMTPLERRRPEVINASRKRRIAAGSGTTVQEVNQLLRQYKQVKRLFKKVGRRGRGGLGLPWFG